MKQPRKKDNLALEIELLRARLGSKPSIKLAQVMASGKGKICKNFKHVGQNVKRVALSKQEAKARLQELVDKKEGGVFHHEFNDIRSTCKKLLRLELAKLARKAKALDTTDQKEKKMKLHAAYKALPLESVATASIIAANRADPSFPSFLQRLGHVSPAEVEAKQLADVLLKHEPLKQRVTKFADLLRHSQTLLADRATPGGGGGGSGSSSLPANQFKAASDDGSESDIDDASQVSSSQSSGADTYSGSDGDGSDDEEGGGWGAQAQPAKAGREARKREQQQQQQQKQKHSNQLKQQKLTRGAGAASAFVSSLRGDKGRGGRDDDVVEHIDVGGGSDRKNRMGQRQRRLLAERKFGSQAKHVAEGRGVVEQRVKGVTKRTNQIDPKTGLAIGISARVMKPKRGGKNVHKEVKQQRKSAWEAASAGAGAAVGGTAAQRSKEVAKSGGIGAAGGGGGSLPSVDEMHPSWAARVKQQEAIKAKVQASAAARVHIKFDD